MGSVWCCGGKAPLEEKEKRRKEIDKACGVPEENDIIMKGKAFLWMKRDNPMELYQSELYFYFCPQLVLDDRSHFIFSKTGP